MCTHTKPLATANSHAYISSELASVCYSGSMSECSRHIVAPGAGLVVLVLFISVFLLMLYSTSAEGL